VSGLTADLRHAISVYRSTPIASAIAVVALAVAMAFVSAFLSMWSDLSLKPPAGFARDGLVTIGQSGGYTVADSNTPLTLDIVETINESVRSLQFTAGIATFPQWLHRDNTPIAIQAEAVTRHFSDLQPRLASGRLFDEQDHLAEAEPTVILSYRLWQETFGGREDLLNQTLRISEVGFTSSIAIPPEALAGMPEPRGQNYRIVGIMSPRMSGTFVDTTDIWLPYEQAVPFLFGDPEDQPRLDLGLTNTITTTTLGNVPTRMRGLALPVAGASAATVNNELDARLEIESQALAQGLNLTGEEIQFDVIGDSVWLEPCRSR
jgi:hypothetical protein